MPPPRGPLSAGKCDVLFGLPARRGPFSPNHHGTLLFASDLADKESMHSSAVVAAGYAYDYQELQW